MNGLEDLITSPDAANYFQVRRWRATATTWFEKVAHQLRWQYDQTPSTSIKSLLAEDAARMLVDCLRHAQRLVPTLHEDGTIYGYEEVEREALALVKKLRNEKLARKMEDTSGRTPVEAAAFAAKAEELRQ